MKGQNLIWDLDGTLLDSYGVIVAGLHGALAEQGVDGDPQEILRCVTRFSIGKWFTDVCAAYGLSREKLRDRYLELSEGRYRDITLMPHAVEILERAAKAGLSHFVFTHRGETTGPVLDHLGILPYFTEIITALDGFPHKPSPEGALYLVDKYRMDKDRTWFIGDRSVDIDCARNAGIRSILYRPKGSWVEATGREDGVVADLLEIEKVIEG